MARPPLPGPIGIVQRTTDVVRVGNATRKSRVGPPNWGQLAVTGGEMIPSEAMSSSMRIDWPNETTDVRPRQTFISSGLLPTSPTEEPTCCGNPTGAEAKYRQQMEPMLRFNRPGHGRMQNPRSVIFNGQ